MNTANKTFGATKCEGIKCTGCPCLSFPVMIIKAALSQII